VKRIVARENIYRGTRATYPVQALLLLSLLVILLFLVVIVLCLVTTQGTQNR
jgi:hypothetical protein